MGRVYLLIFKCFLLELAKFPFWWGKGGIGCCALGYHSMEFRHFPDIS